MAFKCVLVILVYIITKALSYISLIKLLFLLYAKSEKMHLKFYQNDIGYCIWFNLQDIFFSQKQRAE